MNLNSYDFILTLGAFFEDKKLLEDLKNSSKNQAKIIYMHPIDKYELKDFYNSFIKYEVGSEEAILALILYFFSKDKKIISNYLEELDIGYLSAESSAGEDEFEEAFEIYEESLKKALILGDDLLNHKSIENIVQLIKNIEKYTDFNPIFTSKELENMVKNSSETKLVEPKNLESFNGTVIYFLGKNSLEDDSKIIASQTFLNVAKLSNNDFVTFNCDNKEFKKQVVLDKNLLGTIALINEDISTYKFRKIVLTKEQNNATN
ncbi:hypothetical protein DF188_03030 [Aliarcobacter skirrowii]|uniref:NADH-quinone oxidoreductase subunit F n=1 Tax=Aliarcobacter skirrowii TaxID=28200 RepID=A0A2U2C191_9BACT|nr:hypothetical protein [Aliarcobacter skirrowii]PWE22100.1 hypothetical protein DF188_03030 [Aliarcobacter skirrowii]